MLAAAPSAGSIAATAATGPPLDAELAVDFLPGDGVRTLVQGAVAIPAAQPRANAYGFYNLELEGSVTVGGRLYDHFAYRFDVPANQQTGAPFALTFQRTLRPGSFRLAVVIKDVQSGRVATLERPLEVPRLAARAAPAADATTLGTTAAVAPLPSAGAATPTRAEVPVRLVAPPPVAVGKQRFEAVASAAVASVTFALDGRPVMTRAHAPFSVELDLGPRAVRRRLTVEAFDAGGQRLGGDEVELNTDGDGVAVRLRRPTAAEQQAGLVEAQVEVKAPPGQSVARVELFLDDRSVAVLRRAPWRHPVALPGPVPAVLRAVATLADGTTAEDSVLVNAPHVGEIHVDLVELYTAVVDGHGRPVRGLPQGDFRVFEEGVEQRLDRFVEVSNLPVHVVLALDTSTSMTLRVAEVKRAALAFLQQLVRPQDEVMLLTFDDAPRVRVGFTHDLAFLANGLEGLQARGGTALYDSLVFALDALQSVKGQRVLVLLSDGIDERSHSTVRDVMELARRAAVTLYTVGLEDTEPNSPIIDRPLLTKLAEETGGRCFIVEGTRSLRSVYREIEQDVRSRYLLAYYSSHADDERSFRLVDVKLAGQRLAARTIRGYYP